MNRLMLVALLGCTACGSDSGKGGSGSGSAAGTVAGHALEVRSAVFAVTADNKAVVLVTDRDDLCTLLASPTPPTGATTALVLALTQLSQVGGMLTAVPPTAGDYGVAALGPSTGGRFFFGGLGVGTGCLVTPPAALSAGTVSVSQMGTNSGTPLQASFQLSFGQDMLTGNLDAAYCAAILSPGAGCDLGD